MLGLRAMRQLFDFVVSGLYCRTTNRTNVADDVDVRRLLLVNTS
jgi:hypothetical protein